MRIVIDTKYEGELRELLSSFEGSDEVKFMDEALAIINVLRADEESASDAQWKRLYTILDYVAKNVDFSSASRVAAARFILNNCTVDNEYINKMKRENEAKGNKKFRIMAYERVEEN